MTGADGDCCDCTDHCCYCRDGGTAYILRLRLEVTSWSSGSSALIVGRTGDSGNLVDDDYQLHVCTSAEIRGQVVSFFIVVLCLIDVHCVSVTIDCSEIVIIVVL